MHPDLTIAVALDRHLRRTAAVEVRSGRPVSPDAVVRPPVVPIADAPVRLRVIPGGRAGGRSAAPPCGLTRAARARCTRRRLGGMSPHVPEVRNLEVTRLPEEATGGGRRVAVAPTRRSGVSSR